MIPVTFLLPQISLSDIITFQISLFKSLYIMYFEILLGSLSVPVKTRDDGHGI